MKPLFDDDGGWTDAARQFDKEVHKAVHPILVKWLDEDYNSREVESAVLSTIFVDICTYRLTRTIAKHKEKKNGA